MGVAGVLEAIFAHLPPEQQRKLGEMAVEISLQKGEELFAPGDEAKGFYLVRAGAVRIYAMSPHGKEITHEIAGPFSAFALAGPFLETHQHYAAALKDTRVYLIKKKDFLELTAGDVEFDAAWIRVLSLLLVHFHKRLADLTLKSPKARIAGYLLRLAAIQDSRSLTLPVPRLEVAALLDMTRETFYRAAREMAALGLVRFSGRTVEILDEESLQELSA